MPPRSPGSSPVTAGRCPLDRRRRCAHAGLVDQAEAGWGLGDQILVDLPDGQTVRCRVVNITDEGTIQVVPEHEVVVGLM